MLSFALASTTLSIINTIFNFDEILASPRADIIYNSLLNIILIYIIIYHNILLLNVNVGGEKKESQ